MRTPKLSIIIPTFNAAQTVVATLESVLAQRFDDWEVWIMDGASTDQTPMLVEAIIAKSDRMHWVSEKDKGVYDAMNKGIEKASGEYLYFMGSDDIFYNDKTLEKLFAQVHTQTDIFYGNVKFKGNGKVHSGPSSLDRLVFEQVSICHQAIFYKHSVFKTIGLYNTEYFIHADYDFNIRCFRNDQLSIQYIDQIVAIFNEQGLSGIQSNADGFHTALTKEILGEQYDLLKLYRSHKQLEKELKAIKASKSYRLGNLVMKPFGAFKKKLRFLKK
ncbi:MAG: glycosyltransferase family 2 protein [Dokdonia sp.]|jgi:glycosyltransferase involved in cell wall biosynthesis